MSESATTKPVFARRGSGSTWRVIVGGVEIIEAHTQQQADAAVKALEPFGGERPKNGRVAFLRGVAKRAMESAK